MSDVAAATIENVSHRYGDVVALSDVSFEVDAGEFVTLLGPSGCGKTTLLRVVGGFVSPLAGRVLLHGRDVTALPPHKRPVNTVFQRPTLFPHLDVHENVAFGLRVSGVSRRERQVRVREALELVRLPELERRRASELSGGQMQRAALARALVNRPSVLLLDEPLSALDLKIRLEMEVELRRVHRETGATFIYVTHDQREALALSDRVAVFSHGRLEQIASPQVLYSEPTTEFTARFVGDANVLPVAVDPLRNATVTVRAGESSFAAPYVGRLGREAWLVLRPESLSFGAAGAVPSLSGVVRDVAFRGTAFTYRIAVPGFAEELKAEIPAERSAPASIGTDVVLTWNTSSCWLLPRETEATDGLEADRDRNDPEPPNDDQHESR